MSPDAPSRPSDPQRHLDKPSFNAINLGGVAQNSISVVVREEVVREIAEKHELNLAIAQNRRRVSASASQAQRQRARSLFNRRCSLGSLDDPDAAEGQPNQPSLSRRRSSAVGRAADKFNRRMCKVNSNGSHPESLAEGGCGENEGAGQDPRSDNQAKGPSILGFLSHRNSRPERLRCLSEFCKHGRKQERLQQVLEARQREFEQKPEHVRRELQHAYESHDLSSSGALDAQAILGCLCSLGLMPKTDVERKALLHICGEHAVHGDADFLSFSFKLVPRVRQRLKDLRHGDFLREFQMYDKDSSGYLDKQECKLVLERLCTGNLDPQGLEEMEGDFDETLAEVANGSGLIDFEGFQELIARASEHHQRIVAARQEHIQKEKNLTARDLQQHADELVILYDSFQRADRDNVGKLQWATVFLLLIELGLLTHNSDRQDMVFAAFSEVDANADGCIDFREYLQVVRLLRRQNMLYEEHNLKRLFSDFDRNQNMVMEIPEISQLLREFGIQPRSREEQWEMRCLLDEIDVDRSGNLNFQEFTQFVQRIRERLRIAARRHQRALACKLGLEEELLLELRRVFFLLDVGDTGHLSNDQLRQVPHELKHFLSPKDLRGLVSRIADANLAKVSFHGFLTFFGTEDIGVRMGAEPVGVTMFG